MTVWWPLLNEIRDAPVDGMLISACVQNYILPLVLSTIDRYLDMDRTELVQARRNELLPLSCSLKAPPESIFTSAAA